jgi:hypothetical protein
MGVGFSMYLAHLLLLTQQRLYLCNLTAPCTAQGPAATLIEGQQRAAQGPVHPDGPSALLRGVKRARAPLLSSAAAPLPAGVLLRAIKGLHAASGSRHHTSCCVSRRHQQTSDVRIWLLRV